MPEISVLPPLSDPRWTDVATGKIVKPWKMLAMKVMMTRVTSSIKMDSSPANLAKQTVEIREFFERNMKLAQADLEAIFG